MKSNIRPVLGLVWVLILCSSMQGAEDYRDFASWPDTKKELAVWHLFNKNEFFKPEHKPICRDLLATQGKYCNANAVGFTSSAIGLAEKQGWKDLRPLVAAIYKKPTSIWVYAAAFRCLRKFEGKSIDPDLVAAAQTLRLSGFYQSHTTQEELLAAQRKLRENSDKEAVLVYSIYVASWHSGKAGTQRGRIAAGDVLKTLDQAAVRSTLKTMRDNFDDVFRSEIKWAIRHLKLNLD